MGRRFAGSFTRTTSTFDPLRAGSIDLLRFHEAIVTASSVPFWVQGRATPLTTIAQSAAHHLIRKGVEDVRVS
jgi:hypothetical protein